MTKLIEYTNYKIKDMGKVITGRTPSTSISQYFGNQYMFITPGELSASNSTIKSSKRMLSQEGMQNIQSSMIDGISVLVGCIGWDMGNVSMCFEKCATNQQINSITKFNDDINPFYIYYWLTTKKEYLFQIAGVTRTPILNKSTFEAINIPIPTKSYQDKIADVLYALDSKIELNNKINQELEAMAQTLYNYWFTQFDFPDKNGKPYQSSGGKMVWNDKLKREIPEGWEVITLRNILEKNSTSVNSDGNKKLIDLSKMPQNSFCINEFNSGDTFKTNMFHMNKYDILFGSIRPYLRKGGFAPFNGLLAGTVHSFKVKNDTLFNFSLLTMMHENTFKYAINCSEGTKMPVIKADKLLEYKVAFNDDIVSKFNDIITFKEIISNNICENEELKKTRDFLLPMLMSGQATVE